MWGQLATSYPVPAGVSDVAQAAVGKEHVVVVTHGLTIRCFVMRFLHLSVEQFEALANPANASVTTIAPKHELSDPTHTSGRWATTGLKLRADG